MYVDSNVPFLGHDGLAGVEAHPHGYGSVDERSLGVVCGGDRVSGARERHEERVSLRVDLDPTVPRERFAQGAAVLREHVSVSLTEIVQKAR
jgi:hypothetical protein